MRYGRLSRCPASPLTELIITGARSEPSVSLFPLSTSRFLRVCLSSSSLGLTGILGRAGMKTEQDRSKLLLALARSATYSVPHASKIIGYEKPSSRPAPSVIQPIHTSLRAAQAEFRAWAHAVQSIGACIWRSRSGYSGVDTQASLRIDWIN